MVAETDQSQQSTHTESGDESEPCTTVSRRAVLSGVGIGVASTSAWASSVVAGRPGLAVEVDGDIEPETTLVVRVRDGRGRMQEFTVDGSTELPASTTLSRIRTDGEAEFDLLVYGDGAVTIDKLEFRPTTEPYPEDSGGPGPLYAIAKNIHMTTHSILMYAGLAATLAGTAIFGTKRLVPPLELESRSKKLVTGGIILLFLLIGMGAVVGILDWLTL